MKFTDIPNTSVQVKLAPSAPYHFGALHIGMDAFLNAEGLKCASYQLLGNCGKAIASCFISGDLIEETLAAGFVDISSFHDAVRLYHASIVPEAYSSAAVAA